MKLQRLLSYTRKALDTYNMIKPHDKIAIGISGGKDSLAMLYALSHIRKFYPVPFELVAICVSLGFEDFDLSEVQSLCIELDVPFHIVQTDIGKIIFDERKESNPCSLCSKLRKGALNNKALELNCTSIALGHHKEDIVETMMMSLFFEGRFKTFEPVTYLDRTKLTSIRPLLFVPEREIIGFTHLYNTPVVISPCPANGHTKREEMKDLLSDLNHKMPGVSNRMFKAILTSGFDGWSHDGPIKGYTKN
jgi:tRNA(Ile)-lysidine synthase TilS/MesJ